MAVAPRLPAYGFTMLQVSNSQLPSGLPSNQLP